MRSNPKPRLEQLDFTKPSVQLDEDWIPMRLCERCKSPVAQDWDFAWCQDCGETGVCHHGNVPHDCNPCMIESDWAFDFNREVQIDRLNFSGPAQEKLFKTDHKDIL